MTADLETDVLASAHAGFKALELWGAKIDKYLVNHSLDDLEDLPKEAITDAKRILPGLGVIPLADICQRLKKLGYDGDCSVELFRPEYWDWDPKELAVQVRAAALRVLSPYFEVQ
jgi:2-keto-myo-inositol isomerase